MPWQCEGEKRHLIGFLYCRFPSGLISPVSYCVWPVLMVSGDHSIGVFWQRCISSAGHKQVWCVRDEPLHASLVWWRGWYVVSTAGKGRGKFLWNDNSIGRHIKGLLRIEGNKPNPFHIRFQTDVIYDNSNHLWESFVPFAIKTSDPKQLFITGSWVLHRTNATGMKKVCLCIIIFYIWIHYFICIFHKMLLNCHHSNRYYYWFWKKSLMLTKAAFIWSKIYS